MIAAAYSWGPEQVASLTATQIAYFARHLPDVEARFAWPVAQLEATVRNMMGGKSEPDDDAPLPDPSERYSPAELLPPWARPEWVAELISVNNVTREAATDFFRNVQSVPSWALTIAPLNRFKQAAR